MPFSGLQWQIGGLKPTSNIGPWLNDLGQPFYWSDDDGDYAPLDISLSLAGIHQEIQDIIDGLPDYVTTEEMNTAIATAVGAISVNVQTYAFSVIKSVSQTINSNDPGVTLQFPVKQYDLGNCFAANKFTAPVNGIYRFTGSVLVALATGTPTNNVFVLLFVINGGPTVGLMNLGATDNTGGETLPPLVRDVAMSAGDTLEFQFGVQSTGSATWEIDTNSAANLFQGHLIQAT